MKRRMVMFLLGGSLLATTGCLHPPYSPLNDNTSLIPPAGKFTHRNTLPPAAMLMHPGPGVDGPGPGVLGGEAIMPFPAQASQVAFVGPDGMTVQWDVGVPGAFDSEPLVVPGRYNFPQGAIYRLKISSIPGRPGVELYPTLEVAPSTPRIEAYLAHNAIPVQFLEEDFDQILSGNFVTKVIYLPDAEFQELAIAGVETLVSTRLDPGVDPIAEADRLGTILAIIRVGNKDLEVPGSEIVGGEGGYMGVGGAVPCGYAATGDGCATDGPRGLPPGFVAGVTAPEYGMPSSGTPIGLPGPPHIPLGHPAGLQSHTIKNHTKMHIPSPVKDFKIHVKQEPGLSYPKPVSKVHITERSHMPPVLFHQPPGDKHEFIDDGAAGMGADCYAP
jgi:hypothetical protein